METPLDPSRPDEGAQPAPPPVQAAGSESALNFSMAVCAIALALVGQFYLTNVTGKLGDAFVFFGAAGLLLLVLAWRVEGLPFEPRLLKGWLGMGLSVLGRAPFKTVLVVVSLSLAYTVVRYLSVKAGNTPYWDVFWLWLASVVVFALAFVRPAWPKDLKARLYAHRWEIMLVCALTVLAGTLRFYLLGQVPNVISGDEGRVGELIQAVLDGKIQNMFATIYGHGTMYIYVMAGFARLLGGADIFALRFTSALAGTISVPVVYLFARRFFNRRAAFIAAALLTVSHIHVHFSRVIVAGSIQDALFTTLTWYLLLTGLEQKSAARMSLGGLLLGFFLHIYMGARLTTALIPVYLIALFLTNRRLVRENFPNLLIFAGALVVAAAPISYWAFSHPEEFNARMNQIGIFQSGWLAQEAINTGKSQLAIFIKQFADSFLSIGYYPAHSFYYAKHPILDPIFAALFMLGLIYSLWHVTRKEYLLLNGWLWSAILVGGAMVVLPAISAYRILMILPAVLILAAVGLERLLTFAGGLLAQPRVQVVIMTLIVLSAGYLNIKYYFVEYAFTCRYEDVNTRLAYYLGDHLGRLGKSYSPYLVGAPRILYGIHPSVDYLSGHNEITDIIEPLTAPPTGLAIQPPAVFYFTPERLTEIAYISMLFPEGRQEIINDCGSPILYIYVVP